MVNRIKSIEESPPEQEVQVDQILMKRKYLQKDINDLNRQLRESEDFYLNEIKKKEKQIEYLDQKCHEWLSVKGIKSKKLPNGTLQIRRFTEWTLPDRDVMLEFSKNNKIKYNVKEYPDVPSFKNYVKDTGDMPEGTDINVVDRFYVNT